MFCSKFSNNPMDFCIKMFYTHLLTSPNFYGIFKEIFKVVVVQWGPLKEWKCHIKRNEAWQKYYTNASTYIPNKNQMF
jgi:hypothetical protein